MLRDAGVKRFYAYNTEGFLKYANEQLNAQVTEEVIEEVREVSVVRRSTVQDHKNFRQIVMSASRAVFKWLESSFPELEENRRGYPDFVCYQGDQKYGFEVKVIREPRTIMHRFKDMIYRSYFMLNEESFYEISLIFVVLNEEAVNEVMHYIKRRMPEISGNLRIIIGMAEIDEDENTVYSFIPYDEMYINNRM